MALVTSVQLATLAALLTVLEFVLGVISSLAARAFLHGIWLLRLHKGSTEHVSGLQRQRRACWKTALATFLGIWLVLGVALVETSLQEGFQVQNDQINSTSCVSMSASLLPERVLFHTPPIRATLEKWVLQAAQMLECEKTAIDTVGVGGTSDAFGQRKAMFAPVCAEKELDPTTIVSRPGLSEIEDIGLSFEMGKGEGFTLFPHDRRGLGSEVLRDEERGVCAEMGLSSYAVRLPGQYETQFVHTMNMSQVVQEKLCKLHGKRKNMVMPQEKTDPCLIDDEFELLDFQCLRKAAPPEFLYETILPEMSSLFVGASPSAPSYVCLNSTIRYEYVLIQPQILQRGEEEVVVKFPVIVPTTLSPLDGHCERTAAPLGQAALMYTMDAEWTDDEMVMVPRVTRYHAYMMAVSSSQFPFENVSAPEDATDNGKCLVRRVLPVTVIPTDWEFILLISGLVAVLLVVSTALVFRSFFLGESWSVGSAQWSLDKLLRDGFGNKKDAQIEVVPVAQLDVPVSIGSLAASLFQRIMGPLLKRRVPRETFEESSTGSSRLFEYRLHTTPSEGSE